MDCALAAVWLLAGSSNCLPHFVCNIPINTQSALQECPTPDSRSGCHQCHFPDPSLQDCCLAVHSPSGTYAFHFSSVLKLLCFTCAFSEFPCTDLEG